MYDYLNSKQYGLGLDDQYLDADSFYQFQENSLDIYPDKLRGSVTGSGSFIKFLERMQQSAACRIYEESGLIKIWYGDILDNSDIKKEFVDNGLSNTNCIITQQNPRSRSVFNEVSAKYFAIYDAVDEPPDNIQKTVVVSDTDYLAEDNNIKSAVSFDLDFLTLDGDATGFVDPVAENQINEIANLVLQKSRLFQEVEIVTSYDEVTGLKLGDLIRCEVDRYGWLVADRRLFIIREIIYGEDGSVSIVGQRHSNTVYGGVDSFTNLDVENKFPTRIYGLNSLESYLLTGPPGPQGRYQLTIYIRATSEPDTPTGGSYVASTDTLTPPTNWFTTIGAVPDGDGDIYFSVAIYDPANDPDTITPTWSVPAQAGTTGPPGSRGSGDWHYRVGDTLKGTYSDEELSGFLAMVVPGTDQDAPLQGDRLWIFASPTEEEQDLTEQQVYIWTGNTWINQAAAIDGNLLVSGTVTADNVVADIGITSPVITGGLLQGAIIRAGLLISQITVFQINQNILIQEPTITFLNSDNETVPVSEVFTQSAGAAPFRIETSGYDATSNRVLTNVSIPPNSRLLNVNQVPLPATVDIEVNDTRRNWGAWGDYTISVEPRDNSVGSIFEEGINIRRPSLTLQIRKSSDDSIISSTAFATSITNINAAKPATQTVDNAFFVGSVTYEGGYSVSTYCVKEAIWGECKDRDSNNYRNGIRTVFNGYVRLVDDQYLRVLTDWDGDQFPDGYGRCFITGRSVAAEGTTDNRFYPQPSVQLFQELETPVLMAPTVSIPLLINNEFVIADPASDDVTVDPIPIPFPPPLIIDGEVTDLVNISANALVGDTNNVNLFAGDIDLGDIQVADEYLISERIDTTTSLITGSGFALQNDDTIGAVLALGNFDGVTPPDEWVSGTDYLTDDGVTYLNIPYVALNDITNSTTIPPSDATNWAPVEITPANYLYYTESTGLVVGGTVTAGSIRGGSLNSSAIPASGESGSYIDLDGGTFVFGNSQENLRFDGTDFTLSGIPVDGDLIINNSIDGNKLNVNTVIARTIRSDNYVAPTLPENPPNQGYSLEHLEGIGFFEEIRADVTGTLTAPSQTPSQGNYVYNTSAITFEYLNVTVGDTWDDININNAGVIESFKGKISAPMWQINLPTNIADNYIFSNSTDNIFGAARITSSAAYEWYSNLTVNNNVGQRNYYIVPLWFGYDSNDNQIDEVGYSLIGGDALFTDLSNPQLVGGSRFFNSFTDPDGIDVIETFSTITGGVALGAQIPVVAKLHLVVISSRTTAANSFEPSDTSPMSVTAGIRVNSAIAWTVRSNDGTTNSETITQLNT